MLIYLYDYRKISFKVTFVVEIVKKIIINQVF